MTPHIIGISGVTGAGKSTLAKILSSDLNATLISWDDFDDVTTEPKDYIDWFNRGGNYSEFQSEELEKVLEKLKKGENVIHPVLQTKLIPTQYIIFDAPLGILHTQTGQYINTCVHIDVPLDVSLSRRLLRDFDDRLKTKEELLDEISFYLNHSRPLYFDHDLKRSATLMVNGLSSPEMQLQIIKTYLNGKNMTQKKFDTYLSLCTEVYDLSKPNAPEDAYEFYRSYAKQAKGLILEPMCGTGRFLLPMLEEGFDVHGFDASEHMLERLHAKADAKNLKPTVWKGFVEHLEKSEKYSLIFIPSGSFGLITDLLAVKVALKIIYDHLEKDGLFIFEVETLNAVPKELGIWRGSRWQRADGRVILLSQLAMLDGPICYSIGKYELVDKNHLIQTEVEEYKIRIYNEPSLLHDLLSEIGFSQVRLVKAFDRSAAPGKNDESIIYECRK